MQTVTAYEIWRTDSAILLSREPLQRHGGWIGFDKVKVESAGLPNLNAVKVTASHETLRRAGLIKNED